MAGNIRDGERRLELRTALVRPLKLWCAHTGRYLSGTTQDVSATGALIEVDHPSLLVSGQRVRVGIAWSSRHMLLGDADLIEARVLRSLGMGGSQRVALEFNQRQESALSA